MIEATTTTVYIIYDYTDSLKPKYIDSIWTSEQLVFDRFTDIMRMELKDIISDFTYKSTIPEIIEILNKGITIDNFIEFCDQMNEMLNGEFMFNELYDIVQGELNKVF